MVKVPPEMTKDAAATASHVDSVSAGHTQDSTTLTRRRNAERHGTWATTDGERDKLAPARPAEGVPLGARGGSVQAAWCNWLAPTFAGNDSAYFTGTYSDEYGKPHGLMLPRNVHKDVRNFLQDQNGFLDVSGRRWICGVERHLFRDVLHWHGIIQGPFTADELRYLKLLWQAERGHARVLPVTDGCASYVTKYALKGDTDSFEWRL